MLIAIKNKRLVIFMLFDKTEEKYFVKRLSDDEDIDKALALAEEVFMEFDAPHFSQRGINSFKSFVRGRRVAEMLADGSFVIWGCLCGGRLIGMLALRENSHISLAFVRGEYHRCGIGRKLYAEAKKYALARSIKSITVNASDYGLPFYRAMGFTETDMQRQDDGIIYTPMEAEVRG